MSLARRLEDPLHKSITGRKRTRAMPRKMMGCGPGLENVAAKPTWKLWDHWNLPWNRDESLCEYLMPPDRRCLKYVKARFWKKYDEYEYGCFAVGLELCIWWNCSSILPTSAYLRACMHTFIIIHPCMHAHKETYIYSIDPLYLSIYLSMYCI